MYQLELVFQSFSSILSKRIKLKSSLNKLSASFYGKRGERNLSRLNPYSLSRFQNILFVLPKLCHFSRFHGSTLPTGWGLSNRQIRGFWPFTRLRGASVSQQERVCNLSVGTTCLQSAVFPAGSSPQPRTWLPDSS